MPAIHVFILGRLPQNVNARHKAGHDDGFELDSLSDDVAPASYFFSIFQNTGVAGPSSTPESDLLQALGAKYCPSGM